MNSKKNVSLHVLCDFALRKKCLHVEIFASLEQCSEVIPESKVLKKVL